MISPEQVTALTAQAANAATYNPYDAAGELLPDWQLSSDNIPIYLGPEIATRGIGIYGQTPAALTTAGFLKPGTLDLIVSPELTVVVLNTPAVWTGRLGIGSLLEYLDDPIIQNLTQIEIMQSTWQGLVEFGILSGNEDARVQATFLQPATRYGVDAVLSWVNGTADENTTLALKIAARQGQYAIDFVNSYASLLNVGVDLPGFSNTVTRDEIDQAVSEIVGNPKIPALEFADSLPSAIVEKSTDEEGLLRFAPGKPKA